MTIQNSERSTGTVFTYTEETLTKMKKAADDLRFLEERNQIEELTPELLESLCNDFLCGFKFDPKRQPDTLFDKPYFGACGCMGPQDGDPFCGCTMRSLRYEYRYDIALKLIDDNILPGWNLEQSIINKK